MSKIDNDVFMEELRAGTLPMFSKIDVASMDGKKFADGVYGSAKHINPDEIKSILRLGERWLEAQEPTQLDRIEAKLDALLDALADEGDDEQPQIDLDGNEIPAYSGDGSL